MATTNMIKLGGKPYPIRFGFAALYEYEQITGRKALDDFAGFVGTGGAALSSVSISVVTDIIYSGLVCGAKSMYQQFKPTQYDVADWVMGDSAAIEKAMAFFSDSFPKANTDEDPSGAPEEGNAQAATLIGEA